MARVRKACVFGVFKGYRRLWCLALIIFLLGCLRMPQAMAWGERGHAIVTQVASRLVVARAGEFQGEWVLKPFRTKELMLAHLSNVPDIVWKDLPRAQTQVLNPAHWINLEYFGFKSAREVRLLSLREAESLALAFCGASGLAERTPCRTGALFEVVGSAPWRVEQLASLMGQELARVGSVVTPKSGRAVRPMSKSQESAVSEALVYAGLMAHFVGDLAQPLHATKDYDGYEVGLGGLHSYFETAIVGELELDLTSKVFDRAKKLQGDALGLGVDPFAKGRSPLELAFSLAANSFAARDALFQIDRQHALVKASEAKGSFRVPASRKAPQQVAKEFESLAVERLAIGAYVLAGVYWQVWQSAGAPSLSGYSSYFYKLRPPALALDYLSTPSAPPKPKD